MADAAGEWQMTPRIDGLVTLWKASSAEYRGQMLGRYDAADVLEMLKELKIKTIGDLMAGLRKKGVS